MKTNSILVFACFIVFPLGVQTASAQFNFPNIPGIPQIPDLTKEKREPPRRATPAEPTTPAAAPAAARAQPLTMDDPHFQALTSLMGNIGLYQHSESKSWLVADGGFADIKGAKCMKTLDDLAAAGVPDSRTIEVRYDAPDFRRGVRTLAEVRKACTLVEHLGKIKEFERWAISAKEDVIAGRSHMAAMLVLKRCVDAYEEIIKAGIAPTDRVPERNISSGLWSGAVEEIHQKWCNAPMSQAKANTEGSEAPYRKVLRNDKLKMVINSPPGHVRTYAVPGGEYSTDANKLAAASVWFDNASAPSNEIQVCRDGTKRIFLRRYTFDAQHNLRNNTSQEYCGGIPASGYR